MKIGPDGSLYRITSSAKDLVNNVRIVKVPPDELNESLPLYKLVITTENNDDSLSENSDEEISDLDDEEISDIQLPAVNTEKEKNTGFTEEVSNTDNVNVVNKVANEKKVKEDNDEKRYSTNHNRNKYRFSGRRNNSFGKVPKNYMNREKNIYNSCNRSFNSPGNYKKKSSVEDIQPWIAPCPVPFMYSSFPLYGNVMEPVNQPPINSHPESCVKSFGLLGDAPYSIAQPSYQLNDQIDQNMTYSSRAPNYRSSNQERNFTYDQNPWGGHSQYRKNYRHQNKKFWNKQKHGNQKQNNWNKNMKKTFHPRRLPHGTEL